MPTPHGMPTPSGPGGGGHHLPTATLYLHRPAPKPGVLRREANGYPSCMRQGTSEEVDERPVLLFFSNRRSGPARRMSSLVAWFGVTQKKRLRVVQVDVDAHTELAEALNVSIVPALVLLRGDRVLGRLDGRATGGDITRLIGPHVGRAT